MEKVVRKNGPYQLTMVMTALNEERNAPAALREALKALEVNKISGEILFFDDGSTDRTSEVIQPIMAEHPNIRLIRHETPAGIGGCFWEGVQKCDSEVICWVAGDNEESFDGVRYMHLFKDVDIVVPFVFNREIRSFGRRVLSKIYKTVINVSFRLLLNYQNGAVMYRRSILQSVKLRNFGFFYNTELLIKTLRKGYLYAEVPIALKPRNSGDSKAVTLRSLVAVIRGYLQTLMAVYLFDKTSRSWVDGSVTLSRRLNAARLVEEAAAAAAQQVEQDRKSDSDSKKRFVAL